MDVNEELQNPDSQYIGEEWRTEEIRDWSKHDSFTEPIFINYITGWFASMIIEKTFTPNERSMPRDSGKEQMKRVCCIAAHPFVIFTWCQRSGRQHHPDRG